MRMAAVNLILFIFFSIIITWLSNRVTESIYNYKSWIYRVREWEKNGRFYQDRLRIKAWKDRVPELGDFVGVFPKKYIKEYTEDYLTNYLMESCKAELTHWAIIFSGLFFLLWNDFLSSVLMFLLAFILNIPFVFIQRYNRPRILQIMKRKGMKC